MPAHAIEAGTTAVPVLRYRDLPAAIDWLCEALGFEKYLMVHDETGGVRFAQLTLGKGMVMLAAIRDSALDRLLVQPDEVGGAETQISYFYVADFDAHYARAKAAGAEIVLDIEVEGSRGRSYSCRDPEGHIWNFGTYNPWQHQSPAGDRSGRPAPRTAMALAICLALIAALAVVDWVYNANQQSIPEFASTSLADTSSDKEANRADELLNMERTARQTAEQASRKAHEQLIRALSRESSKEQATEKLHQALTAAIGAKEEAERASREAHAQLAQQQSAREAAERAVEEARGQAAQERSAREATQRANRDLQMRLARERIARRAAENAGPIDLFGLSYR
jgi:uncharacterized glyoxalase superfamily protein PhnB